MGFLGGLLPIAKKNINKKNIFFSRGGEGAKNSTFPTGKKNLRLSETDINGLVIVSVWRLKYFKSLNIKTYMYTNNSLIHNFNSIKHTKIYKIRKNS